jgi:hypothetical protein
MTHRKFSLFARKYTKLAIFDELGQDDHKKLETIKVVSDIDVLLAFTFFFVRHMNENITYYAVRSNDIIYMRRKFSSLVKHIITVQ